MSQPVPFGQPRRRVHEPRRHESTGTSTVRTLRAGVSLWFAVLAIILRLMSADAQEPRPLPERDGLFAATRANLSRAQAEQNRYAYKERRTDLHVNPFGSKVGTDGSRVFDVMPGPAGVF